MKKAIYISFAVIVFWFASAENSFACSCTASSAPQKKQIEDAFSSSDAVFSGEVVEIKESPAGNYDLIVKFKVAQTWKGEVGQEITITTAKDSAMCGYGFTVGQKYIVYASGLKNNLSTTNCSRTAALGKKSDAAYLTKLKRQVPGLPAGIADWSGEDSGKILDNEVIQIRLKKLLGEKNYASFLESFETLNPIEKDGEILFSSGCLIHACGHLESAIAIDLVNNSIHAAIYNEKKKTAYFNERGQKTPQVITNWAKRLAENN